MTCRHGRTVTPEVDALIDCSINHCQTYLPCLCASSLSLSLARARALSLALALALSASSRRPVAKHVQASTSCKTWPDRMRLGFTVLSTPTTARATRLINSCGAHHVSLAAKP